MSAAPRAASIALLLALAACKGGDGSGKEAAASSSGWPSFDAAADKGPPLPAACSLVTVEQAFQVLGSEAALTTDDPENCGFWAMPGVGQVFMLIVQIQQTRTEPQAQRTFSGIVGLQGNLAGIVNDMAGEKTRKSGQEIDGLGDEAWLSGATYGPSAEEMMGGKAGKRVVNGTVLTVRKGTRILTLNVTGSVKAEGLGARMEVLARQIVERL